MTLLIVALSMLLTGFVPQQHANVDTGSAVHYAVYRADGTPSTLDEVEAAMSDADVVFVGESHNDPIVHFLQRQLLESAFQQKGGTSTGVALSMEMFTRDVQYMVDEYLSDLITEPQFLAASEPWNNYETDYRPMVEFAKEHGLAVVAANAPRRYANRVTRLGRESLNDLPESARAFLPPLPYGEASDEYAEQFAQAMRDAMAEMAASSEKEPAAVEESMCECDCEMMEKMMAMHHGEEGMDEMEHGEMGEMDHAEMMRMHHGKEGMEHGDMGEDDDEEGEEMGQEEDEEEAEAADASATAHGMAAAMPSQSQMLDSQSLWDATMAYSISEHLRTHPGVQVMHVVGSFHVNTGTGIPEHLARYTPSARMLIISVEPTDDITTFDPEEHANLGDFVILSDESLPRTFDSNP